LIVGLVGAGLAESLAFDGNLPPVIDSFSAPVTGHSAQGMTRQVFLTKPELDRSDNEEFIVIHLHVSLGLGFLVR
jgi:hypothetical protein